MASGLSGVLTQAKRAAQRRGRTPSTGHVVLVLLQREPETAAVFARHQVREGDLLKALQVVDGETASALDVAVERAQKLAVKLGEPKPRPIHLLFSIVRDSRSVGFRCLDEVGAGATRVRDELLALLSPTPAGASSAPRQRSRPRGAARAPTLPKPKRPSARAKPRDRTAPPSASAPELELERAIADSADLELSAHELSPKAFPLLTSVGRNLTALAAAGRIDPVIGRDREIEQLLDVLARRRSNNPVLVGPPGVGKTAIVEGLACRIAGVGSNPGNLEGRVLIEVSAGSLISGTGVRGALAERMRALREEIALADGRVLLFIDEIHTIVGGDGPDDLAQELKASLARGELPCIGATTDAEYRRCFEKDAALARRFSAIRVAEPSIEATREILKGLVSRYEAHHAVAYDADALEAAVELSVRYLTERQLPDKAIAVLDQAGARVQRRNGGMVDRAAVAHVIAELVEVPVDRLLARDADKLLQLEGHLEDRVVGHGAAVVRIADTLRKGAAGFRGKRPLGTFLLLGPTGVGKTEMAKAVAEVVFPAGAMTRFDMSELSESHAVARLMGSPPGYVGHEEGGQLTEAVRRRPYQLLLLDEIEKAHPDVLLALLPLLDEGRLTDARGRTVDFTHTIIFMTSNLGVGAPARSSRIGFGGGDDVASLGDDGAAALAAARAALPPELWNRIDEPLWFSALSEDEVREIARRMLSDVARTLAEERGIVLSIENSALAALCRAGGYDASLGARPMRRTIGRLVESPLAAQILAGDIGEGDELALRGEGDTLVFVPIAQVDAAE